ncbi:diacylglycerol kinase [Nocardioides speluncae]|uniref:NAD(P)H-dependent amine dehydrogenase family protein n=1 Tax=Nocardioides speluncae TaxID=2670337 RepID=UPI000D69BA94|nr:diacylglycerol kinase [Nocardioides speluncae]
MSLRVVEWSTGTVGRLAVAGILARPELELVGVWVSSSEKDGKDVGVLADLGRELGLTATTDKDALLALKPDCIVHTAMSDDRPFEAFADLLSFLEAGINVVSSGPVFLQYPQGVLSPEQVAEIEAAGERGQASLHVNGIDPGFANDLLPLVLTSLSHRIDEVRVSEIADYSTYYQPVVNGEIFGFGKPVDEVPMLFQPGILGLAWGSVVRIIAAGLCLTLDDELVETVEHGVHDADIDTVSGHIPKGTRAGVRFTLAGTVDGTPRVVLEHVTRNHPEMMPEWPRPLEGDGIYRVEITGDPYLKLDLTHHGEHGDHNDSGMLVTAMRLVNSVEAVCAAPAGLVTALDLPLVTGRGLVAR